MLDDLMEDVEKKDQVIERRRERDKEKKDKEKTNKSRRENEVEGN